MWLTGICWSRSFPECKFLPCISSLCRQCIEQLTVVQAELQESVKDLTKSRKKYQEAETMAQAVRDKTELDAK